MVRSLGGRTLVLQIRGPLAPSAFKILISDKSGIPADRFGLLKGGKLLWTKEEGGPVDLTKDELAIMVAGLKGGSPGARSDTS